MKSSFFFFFLALSTVGALAQSISNQVLLPAAGLATVGSVSYQQTVGETAVSILVLPAKTLTQGFQQPRVTSTDDPDNNKKEIEVHPNPVSKSDNNILYVVLNNSEARSYIVIIYNFAGSVVYTWNTNSYIDQSYTHEVDMKDFSKGIYIVRVMSTDKQINRSFKIEKL